MFSFTTGREHFLKHLHTLRVTNDSLECTVCSHAEVTAEQIRMDCQRVGVIRTPDESGARVGETISYLGHGNRLTLLISKGTQ